MAIDVTCPSCKTRFQVSEKFAGKKGPCPKCKGIIQVPDKKDEVVIHAPEDLGPKGVTGVPVFKPIVRQEVKLSQPVIGGIIGAVVVVLLVALMLRVAFPGGTVPPLLTILGAIGLAPALAFSGYTFLRDDELEPHRGTQLMIRLIACSVVYPLLWGVYWFVFAYLGIQPQLMAMIVVVPVVIAAGAVAAQASLDLEFGQAALHYTMYLVATVILRLLMGMNAFWNVVT